MDDAPEESLRKLLQVRKKIALCEQALREKNEKEGLQKSFIPFSISCPISCVFFHRFSTLRMI